MYFGSVGPIQKVWDLTDPHMSRVPQLHESNVNPEKEEKHHCIKQKIANYAKTALPMIFDETKKKRPVVEGLSNLLLHSKQDVLMPWAWGPRLFFLYIFFFIKYRWWWWLFHRVEGFGANV